MVPLLVSPRQEREERPDQPAAQQVRRLAPSHASLRIDPLQGSVPPDTYDVSSAAAEASLTAVPSTFVLTRAETVTWRNALLVIVVAGLASSAAREPDRTQ